MRVPYRPNNQLYDDYFKSQVGHGLPVYIGRGGLGNVLSGLFRSVIPIMKRGGKALLKEGVKTGLNVAKDVLEGSNVKQAVKRRATQAGQRMVDKALGQVNLPAPPGEPPVKRIKRRRRIQKRSKRQKDIFG